MPSRLHRVVSSAAATSTGRSIPVSFPSWCPGQSTARDVVALLGAPSEVVQLGQRTAYRYDHTHEKQSALFLLVIAVRGVDAQQDRVWVFFDENLLLTHVGATYDAELSSYAVPPFASSADKVQESATE